MLATAATQTCHMTIELALWLQSTLLPFDHLKPQDAAYQQASFLRHQMCNHGHGQAKEVKKRPVHITSKIAVLLNVQGSCSRPSQGCLAHCQQKDPENGPSLSAKLPALQANHACSVQHSPAAAPSSQLTHQLTECEQLHTERTSRHQPQLLSGPSSSCTRPQAPPQEPQGGPEP